MEIVKNVTSEETIFTLKGRLDTNTSPDLEKEVMPITGETNKIVFDFADLEYLSSAGLRVILMVQKAMKGKQFVIKHPNEIIMDVFDMTGFSQILTIED